MDDRRAFLRGAAVNPRQPPSEAPPPPGLPGSGSAAAGPPGTRCDAPRSRASQNASGLGLLSVQRAPPSRPMTNPGDLVARALEILAEEHEAWQARLSLDRGPRSIR
jgi:hypothetical protein